MIIIKTIAVTDTFPLRIKILRNGVAKDYHFVGDDAVDTFHIGAIENEKCIGIASCMKKENLLIDSKNPYQLRGMAVEPNLQHTGVGTQIVQKTIEELTHKNCDTVWCNAREGAVGFYEKLGFVIIGEKFNIPKVGLHYLMYKNL